MKTVEYFYDRHTKSWVVLAFDENGSEIDSDYCPNKEWRDISVSDFCKKHGIEKAVKI